MKKFIIYLLLLSFATFVHSQQLSSYCQTDTITIVKDSMDYSLITYKPINCNVILTAIRPDTAATDIFFAASAAFTAKNYKEIVGRFVGIDTVIANTTENETGLCSLTGNQAYIGPINDSLMYYYHAVQDENECYFQQMLLIYNEQKVECKIFGKQKPTFRRALVIKDNELLVIESLNRMNIDDFTDMMIEIGCTDAIYMDMGTWSEGFFVDEKGDKTVIGALRQNTKHQTNWLEFKK